MAVAHCINVGDFLGNANSTDDESCGSGMVTWRSLWNRQAYLCRYVCTGNGVCFNVFRRGGFTARASLPRFATLICAVHRGIAKSAEDREADISPKRNISRHYGKSIEWLFKIRRGTDDLC
jgi:hypothetical protein